MATAAVTPAPPRPAIAPAWHTLLLIVALLVLSFAGANSQHRLAQSSGRPLFSAVLMSFEWVIVGYVLLGTKQRNVGLRQLVGGRWQSFEDFLLDVAIAASFWIVAAAVLVGVSYTLGLPKDANAMRRSLDFLVPGTALERWLWVLLSMTAGFCEEVIFRGYLQRQLGVWARSDVAGVLLSALIFGGSHAYEGRGRMIVIAVYGALFGTLVLLRKSLRPGMMAHAWHDGLSGLVLSFLRATGR